MKRLSLRILFFNLLCLFVLIPCELSAQVPVITSLAPVSGPIGTVVTISGTNFSTTPADNIVWFGAVRATVNSATATSLNVVVPAGANYQLITVTVNGLTAYSRIPFSVTYPSSHIVDASAFATRVNFPSGSTPYSTDVSDLDGDGRPDLVVSNVNSNTISVFKNISTPGSLTAGAFYPKIDFATGLDPHGIAAADIDGDGKPDLVVANGSSNTVSIFRNTSTIGDITAGSFAGKVDFPTGNNPFGIAVADIDGDGKTDVIVANGGSNTISVFRNTSTTGSITSGSLEAKVDFIAEPNGQQNLENIAIGDIDGDGKPDMVVTNWYAGSFSIYRNISTPGSITASSFEPKVNFIAGGLMPFGINIGDLDGDGKPDLVITNNGVNTLSVFRNISSAGSITTGSFFTGVNFPTDSEPYNVTIGDIDGDKKPDLAVVNNSGNSVSVYRNTSTIGSINSGSFAPRVNFITGSSPYEVIIGDIDCDSKPDLSVVNFGSNSISVFHNRISLPMPPSPAITSFSPTSGPVGTSVVISGSNFSTTAADNTVWFGAVRATVTAASNTILTVSIPAGATYQPITVTVNGLTAWSGAPFTVTFPGSASITETSFAPKFDLSSGPQPVCTAVGDIDGDGKPDLAIANLTSNTISVYRNISISGSITEGSFAPRVDFFSGSPRYVAIGDIDGDGKPDLVVANNSFNTVSVLRNISTPGIIAAGSFETGIPFPAGIGPFCVNIGDVDGDGKADLVVANYSSGTVSVLRNTSTNGSITINSFASKVDFSSGINPYFVDIRDIDGDGKPDLIAANFNSSSVSIHRNTSISGYIDSGSFAPKIDFFTGIGTISVAIGDIDGDGKPDMSVLNNQTNLISVFRNIGSSGSITSASFDTKVDFSTGMNPYSVTIGDLNGDGKADLAVANSNNNSVSVLRNTAIPSIINTGSFAPRIDFQTGATSIHVAIGDIDGDTKPELIVTNNGSNTVSVIRNKISEGPPPTPPVINSFTPASGPVGSTVTISGANFGPAPSDNIVWFGAVQATVTSATPTLLSVTVPTGATYQPVSVNVNGLTAYSKSSFAVSFPGSHTLIPAAFDARLDFSAGTAPYKEVLSDIDGDGKPDLVVANVNNNSISVLKNTSNYGSVTSGSFAPKIDFSLTSNPHSIAMGDIDGDGKPDLIVTISNMDKVCILRNTGIQGTITASSFSSPVYYTTGTNPYDVAIVDIDVDGKPDLVTANGNNTFSVLRNISTAGSVTTGSFAEKIDVTAGSGVDHLVAFGDIDGDLKPDLAFPNPTENTVSIYRNISSHGSITSGSFAAKVDIPTGSYPNVVALSDADGDGKCDLVVMNGVSSTVSIFRNISTLGSITPESFSAKIDFLANVSSILIFSDIDGDGKPDLALRNYNSVSIFKNTSTPGAITASSFDAKVDYSIVTNQSWMVIGDIDGDSKPDLIFTRYDGNVVSVHRNKIDDPVPPVITSVNPPSGQVGSTVTITGANFSTTPSENAVWFGAVPATVSSSTSASLSVKVPAGATFQPLSVTVKGLTAWSKFPFNVVFPGPGGIDASSFSPRIDFTTPTPPLKVAVCDLDVDGKPDIVVTNSSSSTISVYRNISTSGSLSTFSFAAKVEFSTESFPHGIAFGDLNCDGKPEIIVTNSSGNNVSVFWNTGFPGSISSGTFATRLEFATGAGPSGVSIADIDGDSKPDLVTTNKGANSISVLRNTTATGSVSSSSFAGKSDFTTGYNISAAAIDDIDSDGKPDLVVASTDGGKVTVLRNTSSIGPVGPGSFAQGVDFPAGLNISDIKIGDIDSDGRKDLILTNNNSNSVSVYKNLSNQGSIETGSFSAKVDFPAGTGPNSVTIGDLDGDGKPDLVIACSSSGNAISVLRNTSSANSINSTSFAGKVDLMTGGSSDAAICDLDGDGKPDITGTSHIISIFRNVLYEQIPSGPPVINSITPTSGPVGATVTITGSNFSTDINNNTVWFGGAQATVTASTPTQLTVTVPDGQGNQPVTVTVNGLTGNSNYPFNISSPGENPSLGTVEFESSVLTLNGDGINERLVIKNFETYGKSKLSVYNSRGVLIYSNKDYMNDWDMMINNHVLDAGGYFYVLETDIGVFRGSFSILS